MPRRLFLSGTARAGTSALVNILNQHNHIMMGQERYFNKFRNDSIRQAHFKKERFLDIREGDTHAKGGLFTIPRGQRERRFDKVQVGVRTSFARAAAPTLEADQCRHQAEPLTQMRRHTRLQQHAGDLTAGRRRPTGTAVGPRMPRTHPPARSAHGRVAQ